MKPCFRILFLLSALCSLLWLDSSAQTPIYRLWLNGVGNDANGGGNSFTNLNNLTATGTVSFANTNNVYYGTLVGPSTTSSTNAQYLGGVFYTNYPQYAAFGNMAWQWTTNFDTNGLAYRIGLNGTNFTLLIGGYGSNNSAAYGVKGTNFTLLIGGFDTNFALLLGTYATNFAKSVTNGYPWGTGGGNATNAIPLLNGSGTNLFANGFAATNVVFLVGSNNSNLNFLTADQSNRLTGSINIKAGDNGSIITPYVPGSVFISPGIADAEGPTNQGGVIVGYNGASYPTLKSTNSFWGTNWFHEPIIAQSITLNGTNHTSWPDSGVSGNVTNIIMNSVPGGTSIIVPASISVSTWYTNTSGSNLLLVTYWTCTTGGNVDLAISQKADSGIDSSLIIDWTAGDSGVKKALVGAVAPGGAYKFEWGGALPTMQDSQLVYYSGGGTTYNLSDYGLAYLISTNYIVSGAVSGASIWNGTYSFANAAGDYLTNAANTATFLVLTNAGSGGLLTSNLTAQTTGWYYVNKHVVPFGYYEAGGGAPTNQPLAQYTIQTTTGAFNGSFTGTHASTNGVGASDIVAIQTNSVGPHGINLCFTNGLFIKKTFY